MALGSAASAPRGFVEFCERQPADCGATTEELATLRDSSVQQATMAGPIPVRFDWSGVFGATGAVSPAAAPRPPVAGGELAAVSFDWSATFAKQPTAAAPVVEAATEASPEPAAAAPAEALALTPQLWAQVVRANDQVNRAIAQKTDAEAYGAPEFWSLPIAAGARYGDCEDYVLEKRRALLAAGVPQRALSIAVVNTPEGDVHAVLLVETAAGAYVLDNLTPWVLPWTKTAYRWRERQVAGSAARWAMAAPGAQPADAALLLASLR